MLAKLIEKSVVIQLGSFLEDNELLDLGQTTFRRGSGAETMLTAMLVEVYY